MKLETVEPTEKKKGKIVLSDLSSEEFFLYMDEIRMTFKTFEGWRGLSDSD